MPMPTQGQQPTTNLDTATKLAIAGLLASTAADMWTTEAAINAGGREANPLLRSQPIRLAVKPAIAGALAVQSYRYAKRGDKKKALITALVPAAMWTAAAINNSRHLK